MDEETTALDAELRRLYDEATSAISSLRSLGAPGTKPKASELNKDITATCKHIRKFLRDLEQLAEEQDTTEASLEVEQLVRQHKFQYERLKTEQENAIAEMKKTSELAWRKQRQELLAGGGSKAQINDDRTAVAASQGITESLRRTRQLMQEQIGATDANTQLIGTSTTVLGKSTETLESQRGLFASSRRLLTTMSWYDVLDKIVLYGGVGFFLLVVLYIVQKRMLGLTPDIVKTTITTTVGRSFETATDYYRRYVVPDAVNPIDGGRERHVDDGIDTVGEDAIDGRRREVTEEEASVVAEDVGEKEDPSVVEADRDVGRSSRSDDGREKRLSTEDVFDDKAPSETIREETDVRDNLYPTAADAGDAGDGIDSVAPQPTVNVEDAGNTEPEKTVHDSQVHPIHGNGGRHDTSVDKDRDAGITDTDDTKDAPSQQPSAPHDLGTKDDDLQDPIHPRRPSDRNEGQPSIQVDASMHRDERPRDTEKSEIEVEDIPSPSPVPSHLIIPDKDSFKATPEDDRQEDDPYEDVDEESTEDSSLPSSKDEL